MPDFSLVPVDHQPDFSDVTLVPVDHDPFSGEDMIRRGQVQQAQTQLAQPQRESQPQQPATGTGQPDSGTPASGTTPDGSQGGRSLDPVGSGSPNQTSDQTGQSEPAPFGGYANPTLTESLVNKAKMNDQATLAEADLTGKSGRIIDGGEQYHFVTTKAPIAHYQIDGGAGTVFTVIDPFFAFDGTRTARIEASRERPATVTVRGDGTFTINRP